MVTRECKTSQNNVKLREMKSRFTACTFVSSCPFFVLFVSQRPDIIFD